MDWQQIAALGIVAVTAAVFIWGRMRRRKSTLPCGSHCGCSGGAPGGPSVVYHTRKGQRPEIVVKLK